MVDVFLNERFVGTVADVDTFLKGIKQQRREGVVPEKINIGYDEGLKEIHVETTKGRCRRPLIIVENGKSKLTEEILKKIENQEISWEELIKESTKPKVKQKIRNELARRGIKIVKRVITNE